MNTLTAESRSRRAFSARTFCSSRLLVALLSLAALAFASSPALATTYYFSAAGSDGNSGTDPGAPKQSLAAAAALALPGNTLLFKRGDTWYSPTASFDLRNKSGTAAEPIVIDAYDVGEKPVIAALRRIDDADWSNVAGTTTWQASVSGFSDAWRLFVDGVSKYKVNTSNAGANETSVDQPHEWYIKAAPGGATVFVNTGSATVGPVNVEVHPVGSVSTVLMKNTNYLTIRNLDIRGGSQFNVVYVEAPSSNLTFDHNTIQRAMGSGLLVTNLASATTEWVSNVTITNNLIDKVWSTQENDPAGPLSGDGVFILHAVDTGLIKGNVVKNWGHVGITLSSYRAGFHGVHNFVVEDNDVSAGASGYMHALDVDGFEGLTTNNTIRRNLFHDYTSTIHAQGSNNKYYSNIFVGVTLTTQPRQSQQPWGLDLIPWQYTDGNWMSAHDNYIVNNTFVDVRQYPMVIGDDPSSPNIVGNNVVANNIVYRYALNGSGGSALNVVSGVRGQIFVRHNDFWNFSDTAATVRYLNSGGAIYTAGQLNAAYPQACSGNAQVDPGFADVANRDFRLTAGSPDSVKSGGLNLAAVMGAGFTDFAGNPWHPSNPSMGAFQAAFGDQLLSQGKAVTYSTARSGESTGMPVSYLTDGDTSLAHLVAVGNANQLVSATVNLGAATPITRLKMWHYWGDGRKYKDVIVQLSTTANFSSGVTTVFNNDSDNSAGFGAGTDAEYPESAAGKEIVLSSPITAQYVRYFIAGNSVNGFNHYVELQAFGYGTAAPVPPTIIASPPSQTVDVGTSISFGVTAVGTGPFTYQWRKNGANISGATAASYSLPPVSSADAASYDAVVTNSAGAATSPAAVLTVNTPIPPEPSLSLGKPVTYSAIRSGESSGTPVSYLTDGDTSLTHLVAVGNAGQLVSATVNLGQMSEVARIRMWHYWGDARKYKDVIVQLSSSADFTSGVTTVFNNDADNSAGFGAGPDAEYAETPAGKELVLSTPVLAQYARFFIAGNSVNAFNHYVELQVFGSVVAPPTIAAAPSDRTATVGDRVEFGVTAEGDGPLSYQWRKAGVAIAGATGPAYAIPSALTADAGAYDVIVSNVAGSVTSASAVLTVNRAVAAITLGNLNQTFDGAARSPVVTTTPAGLGYTMTYDGRSEPPVNAGSYAVVVTVADADYAGTANGTLSVAPASVQLVLGGLARTYDGTPQGVTLSTSPLGVPCAVTYDGSAMPPTNAGTYLVAAGVTDPNYVGAATATLVIARASATITFAGLLQSYDGTSRPVTATTVPADLPVSITYDGSAAAPVVPGSYSVAATVTDPNYAATAADSLMVTVTAWVRHLTTLNGGLDGSLQVSVPENVTFNGNAWLAGDLLIPGVPTVRLNGSPVYGGTLEGEGSAEPTGHVVTLNGNAVVRHVVRRVDPREFPALVPPSLPSGTRNVSLNSSGQSPGDFATLRNLTLSGSAGQVAVPPGAYGNFVVNGSATLVLGLPDSAVPSVYDLQGLTINGNGRIVIVGSAVLNVGSSVNINGSINSAGNPVAFELNVASGGVTLNGGAVVRGYVTAPAGTVTINGNAVITGEVIADRLTINGTGKLQEPAN